MASYLVTRRLKIGADFHYPGEVLDLDPAGREATILFQRGYVHPVPADYPAQPSPARPAPDEESEEQTEPKGEDETTENGEGESKDEHTENGEGESTEDDLADLLKNSRDELNQLAVQAGVAEPEKLPTKQAVAEAILEAVKD